VPFARKPRLGEGEPERLAAQFIRGDEKNVHLTLEYPLPWSDAPVEPLLWTDISILDANRVHVYAFSVAANVCCRFIRF